jgi:hypothetical protein
MKLVAFFRSCNNVGHARPKLDQEGRPVSQTVPLSKYHSERYSFV